MKGKNETIDKEKKLYKLLILYNVIMLLKYDLSILDLNQSGDQKYEYKIYTKPLVNFTASQYTKFRNLNH